MTRALSILQFVLNELGTMVMFYLLLYTLGLKAAIAGSLVYLILDGIRRHVRKIGYPQLYILTSVLTFLFGGIDLMAETPFMIKYEAVVTSLVVAASFGASALTAKPMMLEMAQRQVGETFPDRADIRVFFKLMTFAWAVYFVLRAAAYFWVGAVLPIEQAMEVRPFIGTPSLLVMIAISFQGRRLFALAQRLHLLPVVVAETAATPTAAPAV
jgi:intracellular septation protein A